MGAVFGAGGGDEVRRSQFLDLLQRKLGGEHGRQVWEDLRQRDDPEANVAVPGRFAYGCALLDRDRQRRRRRGELPARGPLRRHHDAAPDVERAPGRREAVGIRQAAVRRGPPGRAVLPADHARARPGRRRLPRTWGRVPGHLVRNPPRTWHRLRLERDLGRLGPGRRVRRDALRRKRHDVPLPRRVPADDDVRRRHASSAAPASRTSRSSSARPCTARSRAMRRSTASGSRSRESARRADASSRRSASSSTSPPNRVHSAKEFVRTASEMELTFNWVYADSRSIAQFTSGRLPLRPASVDPGLPTKGTGEYEWQGFAPGVGPRPGDRLLPAA